MSAATIKLLSEFKALKVEEKQEFVREVIHHLPPWDSGPLNDDVVTAAGDDLACEINPAVERAHFDEIRKRRADVLSGKASLVDGAEALREVRAALRK
jgi:hypothetical protein